MTFLRLSTTVLLTLSCLVPASFAAKSKTPGERPEGTWKGYIVTDAATGQALLEDNADLITPPASMTKLMTFAVLHDKLRSRALSLDTPVPVTAEDARMGGTQVYLDPSETFSVEELIYAMMIQSANDAAHALARVAAGSDDAFVALMNAKARELGMTNTTFRTPHGLPASSRRNADGDLTTPRDFAKLCRHLVTQTDVLKYASARERDFGPARPKGPQHMLNHNKLLGRVEGVDGLKTGYTKSAGYCLSATALRNGRRVIIVIMGCFGPGGQIDRGVSRDRKTIELFNQGFAALPADSPAFSGPPESPVSAPPPGTPNAPAPSKPDDQAPMVRFNLSGKK